MHSSGKSLFPVITAFSVAFATLMLQIVETRIYSVVFWNHIVYLIVSVALLGFGISGTWLAFGDDNWLVRKLTLRAAAIGFVLTGILSGLIIPQFGVDIDVLFVDIAQTLRLLITYGSAICPYFFGGWILGSIYRRYADRIHFLYFADLLGAALGCLAVLLLMQVVGAIVLVAMACAMVAAPILFHSIMTRRRVTDYLLFGAVAAALSLVIARAEEINRRIQPDKSKNFSVFGRELGKDRVHELSEWNILARTDVIGAPGLPHKRIYIDGAAFTGMLAGDSVDPPPFNPQNELMLPYGNPYLLSRSADEVLIIGSGGGLDVRNALRGGAKHIDAVEINPTTARIVKHEYDSFLHGLFNRPEVVLTVEDGRSFVRSRDKLYDVIIMHAIDTFAAIDAGAYVLAENYLYTVDAMVDYMKHLKPDGVLSITRWCYAGETPRLFVIMLEALYELGYEHPDRHLAFVFHNDWTAALASPAPFTEEELRRLGVHAERHGGYMLFPVPPEKQFNPVQKNLNAYAKVRKEGTQEIYYIAHFYNIRPVYDDNPFFFHYDKMSNIFRIFEERTSWDFIRGHWPSFILVLLLILLSLALALFVFLPLRRRGGVTLPSFGSWLVYFCCLGIGFIFVEICFMQRFALLLGHPGRSLALVLAALLFFAGLGSHLKPALRVPLDKMLWLLVAVIVIAAFGYPRITEKALAWPLWMRAISTVLMVAPAALFMGMPFPSGLRAVAERSDRAVPWMWGVNGGATVLGSILAILIAIYCSFTVVLLCAALGYAIAAVLYPRLTAS